MTLNLREYFSFFLRKFKAVILEILNKPKGPNKSMYHKTQTGVEILSFFFCPESFSLQFSNKLAPISDVRMITTFHISNHGTPDEGSQFSGLSR